MKKLNLGDYYPQILIQAHDHQVKIDQELKTLVDQFNNVTLVGVGTSYNGAQVAMQMLNQKSKHFFNLQYSNTFYFNQQIQKNVLYILISQSGESKEIIKIAQKIKKCGAKAIALSENPNSSLGKTSNHFLLMHDFIEKTPFKSLGFSSTIISLLRLFDFDLKDLKALTHNIDAKNLTNNAITLATNIKTNDRLTFLGSGPDYGVALEGSLKTNELAWLPAFCYETEDFFHGKDSYVGQNDHYFLLKNDYSCNYNEVKKVLLAKDAKSVTIIDLASSNKLTNLFYKIYFIYALTWTLNRQFDRFPDKLRFRDLLKNTKTY